MITDKELIQKRMETIRVFILDMDGTIYLGKELFPYTHDFLNTVKNSGREYYFFTNNSSRDLETYIDKLHGMGIHIERKQMMVSTHAVSYTHLDVYKRQLQYIFKGESRVFLFIGFVVAVYSGLALLPLGVLSLLCALVYVQVRYRENSGKGNIAEEAELEEDF